MRRIPTRRSRWGLGGWAAALVLLAALFGGCATEPSAFTGETASYAYTWEQELALGQRSDRQIVQEMGVYRDDELQAYVNRVAEAVLAESDMRGPDTPQIYRETEFTFRVLDNDVVNAFALPGGYVYVTRGLLAHLNNEAQLAVVLGHEITHVAGRHASKQALKQQWGQIGLLAGAVLGDQLLENKNLARDLLNLGSDVFQLLTLKYGRDAERESDRYGVEYAAKAGYDAAEGAAFFQTLSRMGEKSGQAIPTWMSSHPDPGEREQTVKRLAAEFAAKSETARVGREELMEHIDGIVVGVDPRQGFVRGSTFYHPELAFKFEAPGGWRIQNEPTAVYLFNQAAQSMMVFTLSAGASPQDAAREFLRSTGVQLVNSSSGSIKGREAFAVEGVANTQSGTVLVSNTFIRFGERLASFMAYAPEGSYAASKMAFGNIVQSFDEVTDASILEIQPTRLVARQAERDGPFRSFLPDRLPEGMDARDWAIMNQVELDTLIRRGDWIKLPGGG